MKRCNACEEEFADKFSFCPVDGSPLNNLAAALVGKAPPDVHSEKFSNHLTPSDSRSEFHFTFVASTSLAQRLSLEVSFVIAQVRQGWPEFKRDPFGTGGRVLADLGRRVQTTVLQPNALTGLTTAVLLVMTGALSLVMFGKPTAEVFAGEQEIGEVVEMISVNLPADLPKPEGSGVGVGSNGRVGLNKEKGEGSAPERRASRGGGGGGDNNPEPAGVGKVPPPSEIPAPINPPLPKASLPVAGVDLDPALWRNLPYVAYGDPRSKSTNASKGPGNDGGIGTGDGLGVGPGKGNGVGPGEDGNMGGGKNERGCCGVGGSDGNNPEPNRVYRVPEVTQRARVLSKPEPQYTEAARKNQVTGSVVLSVIFTESGEVTSIRAVRTLPDGLTERAIAAARLIRFIPASRNGHPVSVYMNLEYNFNLY